MLKKLWENKVFWETMGYCTLAMCVFGQITVGTWYLLAQFTYLFSNVVSVFRDYAMQLPMANKVKDFCFTAITMALIVIRIINY